MVKFCQILYYTNSTRWIDRDYLKQNTCGNFTYTSVIGHDFKDLIKEANFVSNFVIQDDRDVSQLSLQKTTNFKDEELWNKIFTEISGHHFVLQLW